jgi:methylenetetrahydrofolate dehydrogenase (NADP+)/methenyltetrahydrofolate cyclohydrolase
MASLLDGKKISQEVLADVKKRAETLKSKGIKPGLATVLVGDDPASHVYVGQKIKKCQDNGIESIHRPLPSSVTQKELIDVIQQLNNDKNVHGILVQLPLPPHLNGDVAVRTIDPSKDADGLHPMNQGLLFQMKSWKEILNSGIPIPCTPYGVIHMLLRENISIQGKSVVVVGRSLLVGKPVAQLFLSLDATVTMAHSRTSNLQEFCKTADILVAAIGRPLYINKDAVKPGAVIVDVGINRTNEGLKGDVDFESVFQHVSWITPVPGGVGPMTVAMLLKNTISAAERFKA